MQRDNEALDFYSQAFKALEPLDVVAKDDAAIIQEKSDMHQRIGYIERSMRETCEGDRSLRASRKRDRLLVKMAPTAVNYGTV